jgi:hypothetical protein
MFNWTTLEVLESLLPLFVLVIMSNSTAAAAATVAAAVGSG